MSPYPNIGQVPSYDALCLYDGFTIQDYVLRATQYRLSAHLKGKG